MNTLAARRGWYRLRPWLYDIANGLALVLLLTGAMWLLSAVVDWCHRGAI